MKGNKIKISALVAFVASVSILIGIAMYKIHVEPLLTQTPSARSTIAPTPTFTPLSAAELENFFGDASCSWPCWQGIMPGVTTGSDALQRLQQSTLVSISSIQSEGSITGFGNAQWHWKIGDKQPLLGGDMEWRGGIVWKIILTSYPIISLGESINRFGPPEKIEVANCTEIVEGPQLWCAVLYYTKNGFEIHISWERSGNVHDVQITPSDPTDFVVLFKPSTIEEWISSYNLDIRSLNLRDWKGYGNLLDLYVR